MADYISTADMKKRGLTASELAQAARAKGYDYIPTGGLKVQEVPKTAPVVKVEAIQKPVIVPISKPDDKTSPIAQA